MEKLDILLWIKKIFITFTPQRRLKKPRNKKQVYQLLNNSWLKMQRDLTSKTTGCQVHEVCRFHEVLFETVQPPGDKVHLEKLVFDLTT